MQDHLCLELDSLLEQLQRMEGWLRRIKQGYVLRGIHVRECPPCGITYNHLNLACVCGKSLVHRYCTPDYRVAQYFGLLRKYDIYPFHKPFRTCSLKEIEDRIDRAYSWSLDTDHRHECEGSSDCPFPSALRFIRDMAKNGVAFKPIQWSYI
jgi:hypothetical protein